MLDASCTLNELGLQNGDSIYAIVQPVKLASTEGACALHAGGAVKTWGHPGYGGLCSQVGVSEMCGPFKGAWCRRCHQ